ncbi:MAG TPA: CHAT domain-containing protein [Rudaea sp.]|nr:CHAT domain-containing protein [Rudaea sp.]
MRLFARSIALCAAVFAAAASAADTQAVRRLLVAERFDEAYALAEKSLVDGTTPDTKRARLAALGLLLDAESLHADARGTGWADETLALVRELDGERSRAEILPLAYLALHHLQHQQFAKGLEEIERAQMLAREGTGTLADVDRSYMLRAAAWFEQRRGKPERALALAEEAAHAVEPLRTDWQRLRYVNALWLVAVYENGSGHGAAALVDARRAADLAGALAGPRTVLRVRCLFGLAQVLFFQGDYPEARRIAEEALDIEHDRGDIPQFRSDTLELLGSTWLALGDPERARASFQQSLDVARQENPHGFGVLARMGNLAELELEGGNDAKARALYEEILAEEQHSPLGDKNPHLYIPLSSLGTLALRAGDPAAAADYYRRAQATLDASVGEENGEGVEVLRGLGEVALARGEPAEAERRLRKAEGVLAKTFGASMPAFFAMRCEIALAQARQGRIDDAFALASSIESERAELLSRLLPALGDAQALRFKRRLDSCAGTTLTLAAAAPGAAHVEAAWAAAARTRGLAARLELARLAAARRSASPETRARLTEWENAARAYANTLVLASAAGDVDADRLQASRQRLDAAEVALAADVPQLTPPKDIAQGSAVWRRRLEGAALVAFVRGEKVDIAANATSLGDGAEHLYAFVDDGAAPARIVDLGRSDALDALAARWYALLRRPDSEESALREAGLAVRESLWTPLGLDRPQRVVVVPDGPAYRLNFAALPDGDDGYLVERGWRFHTLESEIDAERLVDEPTRTQRLLLVGAVDYGSAPAAKTRGLACGETFAPLAGAAREVAQLGALWKQHDTEDRVTALSGAHADEVSVRRRAPAADVVHFATHGFELGARCADAPGARGMHVEAADATSPAPEATHEAALALSGANADLARGNGAGLLTAQKITAYPLGGVSWVVLAACDSGLGDVVGDEGVFGLRRAFRIAGAHTVVMSLWEIDDAATTDWMTALYRARLGGADTVESMASAELAALASRRSHHLSTHPYYWAGFVAAGDWR